MEIPKEAVNEHVSLGIIYSPQRALQVLIWMISFTGITCGTALSCVDTHSGRRAFLKTLL